MRLRDANEWALGVGRRLPLPAAVALLRRVLRDANLALCLHRVGEPPEGDRHPEMSIAPERLELLLESLLGAVRGRLTVTFDDGYADAVAWVAKNALRYQRIDFVLFVCPEKSESQVGFRWDADAIAARTRREQWHPAPARSWAMENQRRELRSAARDPEHRLATVEALRAVGSLPNVTLGNHTNTHLPLARLRADQARFELAASARDFQRLFGPMRQFAFPFGTPVKTFTADHVALLRSMGVEAVWSTQALTFRDADRSPGALLPRLAVDGRRTVEETVTWLAYRAWLTRVRGAVAESRAAFASSGEAAPVAEVTSRPPRPSRQARGTNRTPPDADGERRPARL